MIPNIIQKEHTFMVTTIPCVHADIIKTSTLSK